MFGFPGFRCNNISARDHQIWATGPLRHTSLLDSPYGTALIGNALPQGTTGKQIWLLISKLTLIHDWKIDKIWTNNIQNWINNCTVCLCIYRPNRINLYKRVDKKLSVSAPCMNTAVSADIYVAFFFCRRAPSAITLSPVSRVMCFNKSHAPHSLSTCYLVLSELC